MPTTLQREADKIRSNRACDGRFRTAYYGLFHLLIADFVLNWKAKDQRARLGRMFDHGKMSQAVFKFKGGPLSPVEADLRKVIDAFGQLQKDRQTADYDVGTIWSRVDVTNTLAI